MTHDIEPPRIYPTLRCKDAEAMIGWLKTVIGFTEHVVYRDGGVIHHAELAYGSSMLMLGQSRDDAYGRLVGDATGRRTDSIYIAVDDLNAALKKVESLGGRKISDPMDIPNGRR